MFSFAKKFVDRFDAVSHKEHDSYYQNHLSHNNNGHGLRVLYVEPESTAQRLGFEPWFDYIVAINNHELPMKFPLNSHSYSSSYSVGSDGTVNYGGEAQALGFRQVDLDLMIQELATIASGPHKTVDLEVWSAKGGVSRTVTVELHPQQNTSTQEAVVEQDTVIVGKNRFQSLGLTVQPQHLTTASHVWKILSIHAGSPADRAQLVAHSDYIIGCDSVFPQDENGKGLLAGGSESLLSRVVSGYYAHHNAISQDDSVPILLYVYNHDYDRVRPVTVYLSRSWAPEKNRGILGCDVGYGLLHRLPEVIGKFDMQEKLDDLIFENPVDVSYDVNKNAVQGELSEEPKSEAQVETVTEAKNESETKEDPEILENVTEPVTEPEIIESEVNEPEVIASEVTNPEEIDPEVAIFGVTNPEVVESEVTNSEVTEDKKLGDLISKPDPFGGLDGAEFFNQLGNLSLGESTPSGDSPETHIEEEDLNDLNEEVSQSTRPFETGTELFEPENHEPNLNEPNLNETNLNEIKNENLDNSDIIQSDVIQSDVFGASSALQESAQSDAHIQETTNEAKDETDKNGEENNQDGEKVGETDQVDSLNLQQSETQNETPLNPGSEDQLGKKTPNVASSKSPKEVEIDDLFKDDPALDDDFLESPELHPVLDSHTAASVVSPQVPQVLQSNTSAPSDMTEIALNEEQNNEEARNEPVPPPPVFSPIKPPVVKPPVVSAYNAPPVGSSGLIAPAKIGRKKRHHGPANVSSLTDFMNEELSKSKATDVNYSQVDDVDIAPPPMHKK